MWLATCLCAHLVHCGRVGPLARLGSCSSVVEELLVQVTQQNNARLVHELVVSLR